MQPPGRIAVTAGDIDKFSVIRLHPRYSGIAARLKARDQPEKIRFMICQPVPDQQLVTLGCFPVKRNKRSAKRHPSMMRVDAGKHIFHSRIMKGLCVSPSYAVYINAKRLNYAASSKKPISFLRCNIKSRTLLFTLNNGAGKSSDSRLFL